MNDTSLYLIYMPWVYQFDSNDTLLDCSDLDKEDYEPYKLIPNQLMSIKQSVKIVNKWSKRLNNKNNVWRQCMVLDRLNQANIDTIVPHIDAIIINLNNNIINIRIIVYNILNRISSKYLYTYLSDLVYYINIEQSVDLKKQLHLMFLRIIYDLNNLYHEIYSNQIQYNNTVLKIYNSVKHIFANYISHKMRMSYYISLYIINYVF